MNAWTSVNTSAGWVACMILGVSAAGSSASDWSAAEGSAADEPGVMVTSGDDFLVGPFGASPADAVLSDLGGDMAVFPLPPEPPASSVRSAALPEIPGLGLPIALSGTDDFVITVTDKPAAAATSAKTFNQPAQADVPDPETPVDASVDQQASGVAVPQPHAADGQGPIAEVPGEPQDAGSASLAFGTSWQLPGWLTGNSVMTASVDEAEEGVDLAGFHHAVPLHHHQPACGPACGGCQQCDPPGIFNRILRPAAYRWSGSVDALFLWQNNIASRPLFISTSTLATALDANQLQTPASVGPRYGLFLHLDDCYAIEGNYFNVDAFRGEQQLPGVTDGYAAADLATPFPYIVDGAQAISAGQIQSAELNWRRRAGFVTWLAGFRWVEWNGELDVRSQSSFGEDLLGVTTGNDLYGGQLGADMLLWQGPRGVQVNLLGKAGVFYNTAYQDTSAYIAAQPPYAGVARGEADQTAFFGELGINGAWWLSDWFAWRLGYSFFWLSGVATPAEQLSLVDVAVSPATTGINTNGSVFLQGITTGIEARW
jgi:hypothetical protein